VSQAETKNMKLLAQDTLVGFGGMGEGMSMQVTGDGRRILWLAHESAPKNFTGVNVTDPTKPEVIIQTELPHMDMRSNSLEVTGDILAVAYQTKGKNMKPAGVELFDLSSPENPKSISFFDCSGPHSRGVHQLWFADGEFVHFAGGSEDFVPSNPLDDQFYRCIDVRNPTNPQEVGRWWYPGTREGDETPPPPRHPDIDSGFRAHNTNVYPQKPDRLYMGYLDGGTFIMDIADKSEPKVIGSWNPHPPYPGFAHTALPLFGRDLMIVTDESIMDNAGDWPKLAWVLDIRKEDNIVPIGTLPMPAPEEFRDRGGRFGAHNLHENRPGPSFYSESLVFGSFFNAGVRAFDLSNPLEPSEVAYFIPPKPENSIVNSVQINDVYVDENRIVYAVDRHAGGLYILEIEV
jgi:hypothetical protein|tara:strand:- start:1746 stop:2957 length:1212 start_codon:yes stop_codon:yes gene_type:complete